MDNNGLQPDAIAAAHRGKRLDAVYLQPTIHNPLGTSMPQTRRVELANLVRELDIMMIEDGIYSFLADDVPVARYAPDHTIFIDSLSKRMSPGLTLGMLIVPPRWIEVVASTIRSGGWSAQRFALEAATRWFNDGTAKTIALLKRKDAARRQQIARHLLAGHSVQSDPRAYHIWLELDGKWRAEEFVAAAAQRGVALTAGSAFAVSAGYAPKAVRLALGGPNIPLLKSALSSIAELLRIENPSNMQRD
jgi:DNA-binding transcriptional MocR family regulator